jgi:hypothetical protein
VPDRRQPPQRPGDRHAGVPNPLGRGLARQPLPRGTAPGQGNRSDGGGSGDEDDDGAETG